MGGEGRGEGQLSVRGRVGLGKKKEVRALALYTLTSA
jgi:hypothetical protein